MTKYVLIGHLDREGFLRSFEKRTDEEAVTYAEGFIEGLIEHAPERHVGNRFKVHEDDGSGVFDERNCAGEAVVERHNGSVRQTWQVQPRRWRHKHSDMTVGDPFDATTKELGSTPGAIRKRAAGRS